MSKIPKKKAAGVAKKSKSSAKAPIATEKKIARGKSSFSNEVDPTLHEVTISMDRESVMRYTLPTEIADFTGDFEIISRKGKSKVRQLSERPRFTGKQLVTLNRDTSSVKLENLAANMSLRMINSKDFNDNDGQGLQAALRQADGVIFDNLKMAVINKNQGSQLKKLLTASKTSSHFLSSEPERYIYALHAAKRTVASQKLFNDDTTATWGIHATNVIGSGKTGKGVRIAILDSGFCTEHPDFTGRKITSRSFIPGHASTEDGDGHGTHCAGIACGNIHNTSQFRYGVAPDAELFIGKVLNDNGDGEDGFLLNAIEWAVDNQCKVISMSLGGANNAGEQYSPAYEIAAAEALKQHNILLIAAAGNDSEREYGLIKPVTHPANCPSIMAVGALDAAMMVPDFSCAGQVDIAAPGVDIISSWKSKKYHNTESGTSMAAPFVAGLAALYWETFPDATAHEIWVKLVQNAKRLNISAADVGAGLSYFR